MTGPGCRRHNSSVVAATPSQANGPQVARQCRNGGDGCAALASLVAELRSVLLDHLEREEVIELLERIRRVGLVDAHARDGACAAERALHRELALLDDHVRWQIVLEERLLAARLD